MLRIKEKMKIKFHIDSISQRIFITVTILIILTSSIFMSSTSIIMRKQLLNKTKAGAEKDIMMVQEKLELFFERVRNDSILLLASDSCQTLLSDSYDFMSTDTRVQYKMYKLMQETMISTLGHENIYKTIIFYDLYGNSYAQDNLMVSNVHLTEQENKIRTFLTSNQNENVSAIHKSPWEKRGQTVASDCVSYLHKVYAKDSGKLVGVIEFEINNNTLVELYQTVINNGYDVFFSYQGEIISAQSKEDLYQNISDKAWYTEQINAQNSGITILSEEEDDLFFLKKYTDLDWMIICSISKSIYMHDIETFALADTLIGIVLLICGIFVSSKIITSITKPLRQITCTIKDIGSGDYNQRVKVYYGGELGTLAEEFNKMLDKTNQLMGQIVETEQSKRESELSLIQMQMTPHFFYNILESICGLIVINDKKTAIRTINLLSSFYRGVLNKGRDVITIEHELEIAVNYLEIMKICHPNKFEYEIDCEKGLEKNYINKLTLQPILENAIHHGMNTAAGDGKIKIKVYQENEKVMVTISDNGNGMPEDVLSKLRSGEAGKFRMNSFGLRNTDERIKLFFGMNYGINIVSDCSLGTTIIIELPLEI